jgi:hypothetical protein
MTTLSSITRKGLVGGLIATGLCLHAATAADAAAESPAGTVPAAAPTMRVEPQRPTTPALVSELPATTPHPNANAGLAMPFSGTPIDVATYHYDNLRTGWNPNETELTQASVKSSKFGLLKTLTVDGSVFAEPLLVSGLTLSDGSKHDVLLVVTAHNSVYAFDAKTYATLWQVNLGVPQKTADVGCNDVTPEYGISATPVIVRQGKKAKAFLVSATEPSANQFHTMLHAIDMANGTDAVPPVEIAPSATLSDGSTLRYDPKNQWVRSGIGYNDGTVYLSVSSHCDNNGGAISGWVLGYDTSLAPQGVFHTIDTPAGFELAAIWQSGFAPAIDTDGSYFAITGNGNFSKGGKDWGESVIHLPPSLTKVIDYFTPANYQTLNNFDADFGSGGVMLLPVQPGQTVPPMAVGMGKDATMFLLNRGKLGKNKAGDTGALQVTKVGSTFGGVWGGPAFYAGPAGPVVFYQVDSRPMKAYSVAITGAPGLTFVHQGTTTAGIGGSTPIVSSNGATAGTGIVWTIRRSSPLQLEAYDAENLGAPIFVANAGSWTSGRPFLTPLQANGRVYVAASGTVSVFGLTP